LRRTPFSYGASPPKTPIVGKNRCAIFPNHLPSPTATSISQTVVSTYIKKQNARAFLVRSGLPFGHGLKHRRFFRMEQEAVQYVFHLHTVYKNRIVPNPPLPGGQQYLFQEVSE
jgi:hypothetical protein